MKDIAGSRIEEGVEFGEAIISEFVVRIQEDDVVTGAICNGYFSPDVKPAVRILNERNDAVVLLSVLFKYRGGGIGTSIVNYDELEIGK